MSTNKTHYLYATWVSMKQRCRNPKNNVFKHYGGCGVKVCERWNDFNNFLLDMGDRPPGYSLDRIDPYGNYEPENCRWADRITQRANMKVQEKCRRRLHLFTPENTVTGFNKGKPFRRCRACDQIRLSKAKNGFKILKPKKRLFRASSHI